MDFDFSSVFEKIIVDHNFLLPGILIYLFRVALELQDRVGNKVGYQVAMESRTSPETRVLFMTTGIFLMRLVNSPESLHRYTHIIMDEVHERDLDIDFSLVVLKHLLARM